MWTQIEKPTPGTPTKAKTISDLIDNMAHLYSAIGQGQNVPNGSFELDSDGDGMPDGWTFTSANAGTASLDTTQRAHGGKSLRMASAGANSGGSITTDQHQPCSPGRQLSVTFQSKVSDPDSSCTIACMVDWFDENYQLVRSDTLTSDEGALNWQTRLVETTAPNASCWAKFRWVLTANQANRVMWLDDIQLESQPFAKAFDYALAEPGGCLRYRSKIFTFQKNSSDESTLLTSIDTSNGQVNLIRYIKPRHWNIACSLWKFRSGAKRLIWTSGDGTKGVYAIDIDNPGNYYDLVPAGVYTDTSDRVVYVDEDGLGGEMYPDVYVVDDGYGAGKTEALELKCYKWGGSAYSRVLVGTKLNLRNTAVFNGLPFRGLEPGNSDGLCCQYNPIKRRLYYISSALGHLHIFNLNMADSEHIGDWWVTPEPTRSGQLTYEKTIGVRGNGNVFSDIKSERITVEYDLETGAERSICFSRKGNPTYLGSVTVCPWME